MLPQTLVKRVESLEHRVNVLEQLPSRVDALSVQISQLRDEMHDEFSAIRHEIRAGDERVLSQVRMLHEDLVARFKTRGEGRRTSKKQS